MLLFDVDGLREVNESLGHAAGDKVLVEVADRLRGLRAVGGAGRPGRRRRVRGDAAAARAPRRRSSWPPSCASRSASRWSSTRSPSTWTPPSAWPCTPTTAATPATLLQRADLAATAAKSVPGSVQLFNPALESRSMRRLGPRRRPAPRARRRRARGLLPAQGDAARTGAWSAWSAWPAGSTRRTARSRPEDFVAVAEHTGQLGRLTEVVLREGLRRSRDWADAGRPLADRGQPLRPYAHRPALPGPGRRSC